MRKRIQQLANGKFDNNGPKLSLSTEKIELEVLEGKDETGSFVITSTNQVKMRGIIILPIRVWNVLHLSLRGKKCVFGISFTVRG